MNSAYTQFAKGSTTMFMVVACALVGIGAFSLPNDALASSSGDLLYGGFDSYDYYDTSYPTYDYYDTSYPTYDYYDTSYPTYDYYDTSYPTYDYYDTSYPLFEDDYGYADIFTDDYGYADIFDYSSCGSSCVTPSIPGCGSFCQSYMPQPPVFSTPPCVTCNMTPRIPPIFPPSQPPVQPPIVVSPPSSNTHVVNTNVNTNTNINNINNNIDNSVNTNTNINTVVNEQPTVQAPIYPQPPQHSNLYCTITVNYNAGHGSAVLNWYATGAVSAWLSDGLGTVAPTGSLVVRPETNRTYTLTVRDAYGNTQICSVFVTAQHQPYVSLTQIPYTGFDGGPLWNTIYWGAMAAWAGAAAYLLVFYRGGIMNLMSNFSFAGQASEAATEAVILNERIVEDTAESAVDEDVAEEPNVPASNIHAQDTMIIDDGSETGAPRISIARSQYLPGQN